MNEKKLSALRAALAVLHPGWSVSDGKITYTPGGFSITVPLDEGMQCILYTALYRQLDALIGRKVVELNALRVALHDLKESGLNDPSR